MSSHEPLTLLVAEMKSKAPYFNASPQGVKLLELNAAYEALCNCAFVVTNHTFICKTLLKHRFLVAREAMFPTVKINYSQIMEHLMIGFQSGISVY